VSSSVGVFLNNGDATFAARVDYATGASIRHLEVADLTQDGVMDIVATGGTSVYTLVGSGTGTFGTAQSVASGSSAGTVLADFDGDSVKDIASIEYGGTLYVHLSTPSMQTTDSDFSLLTVARATGALTMFEEIQDSLTLQKGKLAAGLSRLEVSTSNAEAMRINLDSAVAAIRDIDVATELTAHLQAKILIETNSALFAHAENLSKNIAGLLQA
jgi:flagellin-like hook-associated protein FlgL